MTEFFRIISSLAIIFLLLGLLMNIVPGFPKIPGDFYFGKRDGFKFYFPLASFLVLVVVLSSIFYLIQK